LQRILTRHWQLQIADLRLRKRTAGKRIVQTYARKIVGDQLI
jgi:hypothetical protein